MILSKHEEMILIAIWRLQEDAYGARIRNLLSETTGKDLSVAGLYGPLKRLTRDGFLSSEWGAPTQERGGRSKRYYKLTPRGVAALSEAKAVYTSLWQNLPELAFGGQ